MWKSVMEFATVLVAVSLIASLQNSHAGGAVHGNRMKRNIVDPDGFLSGRLWPYPTAIPYKINRKSFTTEHLASIRQGLALIEEKSCVKFIEHNPKAVLTDDHIEVIYTNTSCISFVGRTEGLPQGIAQPIILSPSCLHYVAVAQQFLHTLGMWHEHQRPDRDDYVDVFMNRTLELDKGNLIKFPDHLMTTLDTPYDYASVMHTPPYYYANGALPNIVTKDPIYQSTIGQRVEMTFHDNYLINDIYCPWPYTCYSVEPLQPCQNGGYQNPKNCSECLCPDGFAGMDCSRVPEHSPAQCPPSVINVTGNAQTVYSPGYNAAGTCEGTDTGCYPNKQRCTTLFRASPGNKVRIQFEGDFGLYCNNLGTCFHWLEIRLGPDLTQQGERVCCKTAPSKQFLSVGEEILVLMRSNYNVCATERRGFKLQAEEVVPDSGEGVVEDGQTSDSP